MKKIIPAMLLFCLLAPSAYGADFSRLIILHTNDSHGFDIQDESHNGMAAIAAYKKHLQDNGYDVILLDAGDAIQDNSLVNLSKGRTAISFMNAAGYDAATLGNHEFDYGQDVLAKRISEARYPIISTNIFHQKDGSRFIAPSVIIEKPSAKIGVVGFTTPETKVSTSPKNVVGLDFLAGKALYEEAQKQVNALKAAGCDLILALGHMGSEENSIGNRSDDILAHVKGIDIFIDGHDHLIKNKRIKGALLVETGNYTKNIGQLRFSDGKWQEQLVPSGVFLCEAPEVKTLLDEAEREVKKHLSKQVGTSLVSLSGARFPGLRTQEMPLGDLAADAFLWQARNAAVLDRDVDAAIVNGGSIRKPIEKGTILREHIASILPYNNQLFACTITGAKLLELLESATSALPDAMGSFPQVAGIKYSVDTSVPYAKGVQYPNSLFFAPARPGSRVTISEVNGRPFSPDAEYTIAAAEFIVIGGDNYGGFALPDAVLAKQGIGCIDADALENYIITELKGVIGEKYAEPQGRITIR